MCVKYLIFNGLFEKVANIKIEYPKGSYFSTKKCFLPTKGSFWLFCQKRILLKMSFVFISF